MNVLIPSSQALLDALPLMDEDGRHILGERIRQLAQRDALLAAHLHLATQRLAARRAIQQPDPWYEWLDTPDGQQQLEERADIQTRRSAGIYG